MKAKKNKLVCGVGINDADYPTHRYRTVVNDTGVKVLKLEWKCPFYRAWTDMLKRCYYEKRQIIHPTYQGVTVCEQWHLFSNFKSWMEKQRWEGNALDKDLLVKGNKVYSPETCCFVSRRINSLVVESQARRGEWPIGVYLPKRSNKFRADCCRGDGKGVYLGLFETPDQAHVAWKAYKHELALEYATALEEEGYPAKIVLALRTLYL